MMCAFSAAPEAGIQLRSRVCLGAVWATGRGACGARGGRAACAVRRSRGARVARACVERAVREDVIPEDVTFEVTPADEDSRDAVAAALRSPSLDEYAEQRAAGLTHRADIGMGAEFYDVWALAVQDRKAFELKNQYARVGIMLSMNYSDFAPVDDDAKEVVAAASIELLSSVKARAVYHATGMPAIAETHELEIDAPQSGSRINKTLQQGYHTRDVEGEADAMIDRVRPISEENRITRFRSVVAYYDGESEILMPGQANVAIVFSAARYCTVAISTALDSLYVELTKRLGLSLVPPGRPAGRSDDSGKKEKQIVGAMLLRERIMREGEMLDDGIIKVSSFLNHKVDSELMEACGVELAERLRKLAPTKILTVESTGLIPGLPTARQLNIPLVFARKSRPITISDSYQTSYRSATRGTSNELIVSCEYLNAGDRVAIIDDFLAGGSTAEALFKLASMAHAKVVGVGVLIEKMSDGGRAFLSGYNVPVESLAKVIPGSDTGRIEVMEEEPWVSVDDMVGEPVDVTSTRLRAAREIAARRARRLGEGLSADGEEDDVSGLVISGKRRAPGAVADADADDEDDVDEDDVDDDDLNVIDMTDDDDDELDDFDRLQDDLIRPRV